MTQITRRESLALAAALPLAGGIAHAAGASGLNDIARRKGRRFGSAFAYGQPGADRGSFANPLYATLLERDCGLLVPENELKMQALRPGPDRFAFERFDAMLAWAESERIAVRGHNLLWHKTKWLPKWLNDYDFGPRPASAAAVVLTTHIDTVCHRYGTRIGGYDVVNEAVEDHTGELEQTVLSKALGSPEAVIDLAFHTARAAAPTAQLVYNDYMSWEPGGEKHRAGVLRLLEGMRKRGTPIDALGVQSHIVTQAPDIRGSVGKMQGGWRLFLDEVTGMGLKLLVTEFDIRDNNLPADVAPRDQAVADYARAYLDVMLAYPQLGDILCWGMCDRYSWIEGFEPRKDGTKRRPCPYDAAFKPKPMYDAIAAALAGARART